MHEMPDPSPKDCDCQDPWPHGGPGSFLRTPTPISSTNGGPSWHNRVFSNANRFPNGQGPAKRRRINSATLEDPFNTDESNLGRSESTGDFPIHLRSARQRMKSRPNDNSPCGLACSVRVLPKNLEVMLKHTQAFDSYLTGEDLPRAMGFERLSEVTEVNEKLHTAVEIWLRREQLEVDVDYSLFTQAKGKGKV